ncbi:hypothetical protein [Mycobacterium sp. OTB74]|uniref:hypothetical protein n=1 Tax=Mycobacterium sp. OTB74 TaxID=1853452 RepID=UPI0024739F74|nr:hypothetical protein [Mycobacterium sp. OTB74]MDH6242527.1 hypothetical protein [Mycobacterium sp. OTB74]
MMPFPARKYAKIMGKISEDGMNAIIDRAACMLNHVDGPDEEAVSVAVVAHLIFGTDRGFTEGQLIKACSDDGVMLTARGIVKLAKDGMRL